jgi:hypothetical protein
MRAWSRATLRRAFSRFLDCFCFFAWRRCRRARRFSSLRKKCSLPVFSPVESVTTSSSPRSIPTVSDLTGKGWISSSTRKETKYRPAVSFFTVMVVGRAPSGKGRLHRIGSGSLILASVTCLPSQVKTDEVYSADWRPCFFLNEGYLARPSKKLRNAQVLRAAGLAGAGHKRPHSARL